MKIYVVVEVQDGYETDSTEGTPVVAFDNENEAAICVDGLNNKGNDELYRIEEIDLYKKGS